MSVKKLVNDQNEIKWEVRVYEDGRGSKRIRQRFDRKIDAENFLFEFEKKQNEQKRNPFSQVSFEGRTFQTEADYWLLDVKLRSSPGHIKRAEGVLRDFLPKHGAWSLEKFTPEFFSKHQQSEKSKGLANATVDRQVGILTSVLNHSVKHRRIPFNPSVGVRKLMRGTPEMQFWDQREAQDFLRAMNEKYPKGTDCRWVYLVYLLALNTGIRAGEIWGLKPMDLSHDQKIIYVRRQLNNITREFTLTKSKKARAVPLNHTLLMELRDWIDQKQIPSQATIFQSESGGPVFHDNFSDRRFEKDQKAWGGRRIRFHDLRHTATTLLICCGVDIRTVKEICGHSDIKTTMNYIHLIPGNLEKVSQIFSVLPDQSEDAKILQLAGKVR